MNVLFIEPDRHAVIRELSSFYRLLSYLDHCIVYDPEEPTFLVVKDRTFGQVGEFPMDQLDAYCSVRAL